MKYLQALFVLVLALVLAAFIQQNGDTTVIKYFGWNSPGLPLSLFIIVAFGIGYALAVVVGFTGNIKNRIRVRNVQKEAKQLSTDLERSREDTKKLEKKISDTTLFETPVAEGTESEEQDMSENEQSEENEGDGEKT
jgi:uncharacterized integral membrane protein